MRKHLCLMLALCMALGLCGCHVITKEIIERDITDADDEALYEHSMELAGLLEDMLSTPEYFNMMSGSQAISDVIMPYMRSDLSEPESAYVVTLPEDALPALMGAAEVDLDGFSDELRDFVERRMQTSVPTILNSTQGAEVIAAASILTVSDAWAGETIDTGCYVVLMYPHCCPVMVSFTGRDHVMTGTATMLLGAQAGEDPLDAVEELFGCLEMDGMDIKEIETDND